MVMCPLAVTGLIVFPRKATRNFSHPGGALSYSRVGVGPWAPSVCNDILRQLFSLAILQHQPGISRPSDTRGHKSGFTLDARGGLGCCLLPGLFVGRGGLARQLRQSPVVLFLKSFALSHGRI